MSLVPVVLHALHATEELSTDVARRQRQRRVALVRPLVDDEVVVLRERPLAEAALVALHGGAALPAAGTHSLEALGRGHGGTIHRVDGEHGDGGDGFESKEQKAIRTNNKANIVRIGLPCTYGSFMGKYFVGAR